MLYKLGHIGVGEGMALVAMLVLPNIYLSEPSIMIGFTGSSAWLVKIFGGLLSLGILLAVLYFYKRHVNDVHQGRLVSFYQFSAEVLGGKAAAALFVIWAVLFEIQTALTLREFTDYIVITTLTTGKLVVLILFLASCMLVVLYNGLEVILRTAYLLFLVAGVGIVAVVLLVAVYLDPDYLFPWQGYGVGQAAKYSFFDTGTWLYSVAVLSVVPALGNLAAARRAICYGIGYTVFLKVLIILAAVMLFGTVIAPERALIFYEMVQAVNLSQYLQRVDAVFIVIWLTGGFISAVLLQFFALNFICQPFQLKDFKALLPLGVFMSAVLGMLPGSVIETIELNQFFAYSVTSVFSLLNLIVFSAGYFFKSRRKKTWIGDVK